MVQAIAHGSTSNTPIISTTSQYNNISDNVCFTRQEKQVMGGDKEVLHRISFPKSMRKKAPSLKLSQRNSYNAMGNNASDNLFEQDNSNSKNRDVSFGSQALDPNSRRVSTRQRGNSANNNSKYHSKDRSPSPLSIPFKQSDKEQTISQGITKTNIKKKVRNLNQEEDEKWFYGISGSQQMKDLRTQAKNDQNRRHVEIMKEQIERGVSPPPQKYNIANEKNNGSLLSGCLSNNTVGSYRKTSGSLYREPQVVQNETKPELIASSYDFTVPNYLPHLQDNQAHQQIHGQFSDTNLGEYDQNQNQEFIIKPQLNQYGESFNEHRQALQYQNYQISPEYVEDEQNQQNIQEWRQGAESPKVSIRIADMFVEITKLQEAGKSKDEKVQQLEKQLEAKDQEIKDLTLRYDFIVFQRYQQEQKAKEIGEKLKDEINWRQNNELQKVVQKLTADLHEAKKDSSQSKEMIQKLQIDIDARGGLHYQQQHDKNLSEILRRDLDNKNREIFELKNKITNDREKFFEDLRTEKRKNDDLFSRLSILQPTVDFLKDQLKIYKNKNIDYLRSESHTKIIYDLRAENEELKKEIERLRRLLRENNNFNTEEIQFIENKLQKYEKNAAIAPKLISSEKEVYQHEQIECEEEQIKSNRSISKQLEYLEKQESGENTDKFKIKRIDKALKSSDKNPYIKTDYSDLKSSSLIEVEDSEKNQPTFENTPVKDASGSKYLENQLRRSNVILATPRRSSSYSKAPTKEATPYILRAIKERIQIPPLPLPSQNIITALPTQRIKYTGNSLSRGASPCRNYSYEKPNPKDSVEISITNSNYKPMPSRVNHSPNITRIPLNRDQYFPSSPATIQINKIQLDPEKLRKTIQNDLRLSKKMDAYKSSEIPEVREDPVEESKDSILPAPTHDNGIQSVGEFQNSFDFVIEKIYDLHENEKPGENIVEAPNCSILVRSEDVKAVQAIAVQPCFAEQIQIQENLFKFGGNCNSVDLDIQEISVFSGEGISEEQNFTEECIKEVEEEEQGEEEEEEEEEEEDEDEEEDEEEEEEDQEGDYSEKEDSLVIEEDEEVDEINKSEIDNKEEQLSNIEIISQTKISETVSKYRVRNDDDYSIPYKVSETDTNDFSFTETKPSITKVDPSMIRSQTQPDPVKKEFNVNSIGNPVNSFISMKVSKIPHQLHPIDENCEQEEVYIPSERETPDISSVFEIKNTLHANNNFTSPILLSDKSLFFEQENVKVEQFNPIQLAEVKNENKNELQLKHPQPTSNKINPYLPQNIQLKSDKSQYKGKSLDTITAKESESFDQNEQNSQQDNHFHQEFQKDESYLNYELDKGDSNSFLNSDIFPKKEGRAKSSSDKRRFTSVKPMIIDTETNTVINEMLDGDISDKIGGGKKLESLENQIKLLKEENKKALEAQADMFQKIMSENMNKLMSIVNVNASGNELIQVETKKETSRFESFMQNSGKEREDLKSSEQDRINYTQIEFNGNFLNTQHNVPFQNSNDDFSFKQEEDKQEVPSKVNTPFFDSDHQANTVLNTDVSPKTDESKYLKTGFFGYRANSTSNDSDNQKNIKKQSSYDSMNNLMQQIKESTNEVIQNTEHISINSLKFQQNDKPELVSTPEHKSKRQEKILSSGNHDTQENTKSTTKLVNNLLNSPKNPLDLTQSNFESIVEKVNYLVESNEKNEHYLDSMRQTISEVESTTEILLSNVETQYRTILREKSSIMEKLDVIDRKIDKLKSINTESLNNQDNIIALNQKITKMQIFQKVNIQAD